MQKAGVEASRRRETPETPETPVLSFEVFDFFQDTHHVPCGTSAPSLNSLQTVWLIALTSRFCMPRRNKPVKGPQCSPNAMAGPHSGAPGSQHCASKRSGPWNPFFSGEFTGKTKGAIILAFTAAAAQARGPGVTCCPHLLACFLPLSAETQDLASAPFSDTIQPPLGFGPRPLLFWSELGSW